MSAGRRKPIVNKPAVLQTLYDNMCKENAKLQRQLADVEAVLRDYMEEQRVASSWLSLHVKPPSGYPVAVILKDGRVGTAIITPEGQAVIRTLAIETAGRANGWKVEVEKLIRGWNYLEIPKEGKP